MTTFPKETVIDKARESPIVFLVTDLRYGGAEAQVCRVAAALSQRNWNVSVVTMLSCPKERPLPGVTVHCVNMSRRLLSPVSLIRLWSTLRRSNAACLVTFNYPANIAGRLIGTLLRIPAIVTSIRNEKLGGWIRERAIKWTDSLGAVTTTNSHCVRSKLIRNGIVKEHRIRAIRNAIDLNDYHPCTINANEVRAELGIAEDEFLWLAVGRLERQKAYPILLKAMRLLTDRSVSKMNLLIAGSGSLEKDILHLISKLGLHDTVRLLGHREDVASLLNAADSVVLSSMWEGLSNVVMESLAMRTPVVATNVGGVSELVSNGISGFLTPSDNVKALAGAMTTMVAMPRERRLEMGNEGRQHIEKNFGINHIIEQWEVLLRELLD